MTAHNRTVRIVGVLLGLLGLVVPGVGQVAPPRKVLPAAAQPPAPAAPKLEIKGTRELFVQSGGFASTHFSPDGKLVAAGGGGGKIRVFELAGGKQIHEFAGPSGFTCTVRFSPNGKILAAGGYGDVGGPVFLYDLTTGKDLRRVGRHNGGVRRVLFLPDGKQIVTAGFDGLVQLWDVETGKEVREIKARPGTMIYSIALAPDNKAIALAFREGVQLLDLATGKDLVRGEMGKAACSAVCFAGDGKMLATGNETGVKLWEVATGRLIREISGVKGELSFMVFSADGRIVSASSYDQTVRLWEVRTGRLIRELAGHTGWVWGLALAPDERSVASASADGRLLIWDLAGPVDKTTPLTAKQRETLFEDLAAEDAGQAYQAIGSLVSDPANTLPYLLERLRASKPREGLSAEQITRLIDALDSEEYAVRRQATEELERAGQRAGELLRKALAKPASLEAKKRLERLVSRLAPSGLLPEELTAVRAVQVAETIGTPEARKMLETLAAGAPGLRLTEEASQALERLKRPGKGSLASP
jgi:WD40 repeat protein